MLGCRYLSTAGSVSEFATDDGTQHDHASSSKHTQRLTGTWTLDDSWLSLQVGEVADTCSGTTAPTEPFVLRGVVLDAGTLPTPVLALQIPRGVGRDLRLPVGIPAGGDASDPRLMGSPSELPTADGWVLLGEAPGLVLNWEDERAGPVLVVEVLQSE